MDKKTGSRIVEMMRPVTVTVNELGKCVTEVHNSRKRHQVQVDESSNWQYQQSKSTAETMSFPANVVGEAIQMTQDNNVSRMLENQHCRELNDQNGCSHVTPESQHTTQLMQVITKLFLDAPGGASEEYSSASTVLTLLEQKQHILPQKSTQVKTHLLLSV